MKSSVIDTGKLRNADGLWAKACPWFPGVSLLVLMIVSCLVSGVSAEELKSIPTLVAYADGPANAPGEKADAPTAPMPEAPILTPPSPNVYSPYPYANQSMGTGLAEYSTSQWAPNDVVFRDSWLQKFGERYGEAQACRAVPITVGAWHWWHINTGGPFDSGYGIPGENGTYYYSIAASPEFESPFECFSKCGAYGQVRLRDGGTPFRPFYPNDTIWPYEAYMWGYSDPGVVLKGGLIWRRFGLDWDGSFWGNTPYYDGFKLSTGWGISWEVTPKMEDGFKVDRYFQFFIRDYLDGSITGADPISVNGSSEKNTAIARIVPTMQLSQDSTLALGFSGLVGQIDNKPPLSLATNPGVILLNPGDQTLGTWAVDLTYTKGNFKVFGEGLQSYGVMSPARYVSGGPSDRTTDLMAGCSWTRGPIVYRFCYSLGLDDNPSGTQHLFVPGVTVALTKNVELYGEYVFQEVRHSGTQQFTTFENGIQAVLHWQF